MKVTDAGNGSGVIPNINKDDWWIENGNKVDPGFSFMEYDDVASLSPALFNFIVIREPIERTISAYRNKVIGRKGNFLPFQKNKKLSGIMKFDAFVDALCEIPDDRIDIHLRSQSSIIGGVPGDGFSVYRLETIEFWLPHLLNKISDISGVFIDAKTITPPLVTSNKNIEIIISDNIRAKLRKKYSQDYDIYERITDRSEAFT